MTRRRLTIWLVAALAAVAAAALPSSSTALDTIGYRGMHFSGTGTMVSGQKPESKLWFNDGSWWAVLWDEVRGDNYVYRLDRSTHTWVDTGTMVDPRAGTRADALWDGTKLWVASHGFTNTPSTGFDARLYRYSYNATTKTYTLDTGFPGVISNWKSETLVIDKDTTGKLWATWVAQNSVYVNRSISADGKTWGTPFVLPVTKGATALNPDDISSVVSYGTAGQGRIGVMWSHQNDSAMYFAEHVDGQADNVWQGTKTAIQGPNEADDHINLKSLQSDGSGRVFAAVKTEHTASASPLIRLMVRDWASGDWTSHTFGRKTDGHTRPIVLLDEEHRQLYMLATSGEAGGTVYYKTSPINDISFPQGLGTPFIQDGASADMNDATSTKQNLNSNTGLVVLASNDTTGYYWHNELDLGVPALNADFTGTPTFGTAPLTVSFTDRSSGVPTSWLWNFGDGTTSTAADPSHTYTAAGTYNVTLTVGDAHSQSSTITKSGYVTVSATAPLLASFTGTPTIGIAPLNVAFTDTSSGGPTGWSWDFGDGTTSTLQNPMHMYSSPGTYTVSLMVTRGASTSSSTQTDYITVNAPAPLAASFTGTPRSGNAPLSVAFTDTSTGTPTGWSWTFGDGGTSTEQNPTHMYLAPGTYDVSLTVTRGSGSSTTTSPAYVTATTPPPTQTFTPVADSFTKSNAVTTNYGTQTSIRVKNGGTSTTAYNYDSFVKFTVTGLSGTVTSAKLRLFCIDPASRGGRVYAVSDNSWTELGLTAANQPASGAELASIGATTLDTWTEITIPASYFAAGNGTYTIAIKSPSPSDGTTWYSSREGTEPPQLVITTG